MSEEQALDMDKIYMRQALSQAQRAAELEEVPVGALIVHEGQILGKAHNQVQTLKDPTAHAEMIAITQAANALGQKWLYDCTMYVTLEPCSMCAGALVLARVKRLVFGAKDPKTGACGSVLQIADHQPLNHQLEIQSGILEEECGQILKDFFAERRKSENAYGKTQDV